MSNKGNKFLLINKYQYLISYKTYIQKNFNIKGIPYIFLFLYLRIKTIAEEDTDLDY